MLQAVREGLGKVLEAVGTATVVIGLVQQHHNKVIQPQVEASTGEAAACTSGLSALVKATEERVLTSLQAALNALLAQVSCDNVSKLVIMLSCYIWPLQNPCCCGCFTRARLILCSEEECSPLSHEAAPDAFPAQVRCNECMPSLDSPAALLHMALVIPSAAEVCHGRTLRWTLFGKLQYLPWHVQATYLLYTDINMPTVSRCTCYTYCCNAGMLVGYGDTKSYGYPDDTPRAG